MVLALSIGGFGQSVGFKDLSADSWRPPADHVAHPTKEACPLVTSSVSDGVTVDNDLKHSDVKVELTVTETSPKVLRIGETLNATVRLKNLGSDTIRLPWQTDGETVTRVAANGEEEGYEVADIAVRLKPGRNQWAPVWLNGGAALFAHPEIESSYALVKPGEWVDIKIRTKVECGHEGLPCGKIVADEHASLTAWWYQRSLTHRIHECHEDYGNSVIRELDSKAFPVVVTQAKTPTTK